VCDAIFVGRFIGETALAGISIAYPLTQFSVGIGSMIGVGAGSLLSIVIGSNDTATQKKLIANANYLIIICGILMTAIGLLLMNPLLKLMGASGDELIFGADYFRVTLYGSVFWIAGLGYNMVVRAEGKMKSAALMMGTGLVVNIIANYLLIVVFQFGVEGAAWGTNLGMLVYTVAFFVYCRKKKATFETNEIKISRDKNITKQILSLGFPSLIMTTMSVVQGVIVMYALNSYGTASDVAFYGVVYRIFLFLLTPIFGLMRALQPAMGINFGAKQYDRVISSFKVFAVAAFIMIFPFWLIMMLNPNMVLSIMLPTREFLRSDLMNFRIFVGLLPVLPIMFMAMTMWPAINNSKPAGIIGITRQLIFYVPAMLVLPKYFGVGWVYKGAFFIDLIIIIIVCLLVKREFSKLRRGDVIQLKG
ncbi:MAG: MATE family efflux transporter, partial [Clostridia bacterium]|nr:MATE family efflux transporter [Clostridia bacterium]